MSFKLYRQGLRVEIQIGSSVAVIPAPVGTQPRDRVLNRAEHKEAAGSERQASGCQEI